MMSIHSMAVAYCEEMESQLSKHVWHQNIRVLILFVRVPRLMSNTCCKGELGDAVEALGCDFHFRVKVDYIWWCCLMLISGIFRYLPFLLFPSLTRRSDSCIALITLLRALICKVWCSYIGSFVDGSCVRMFLSHVSMLTIVLRLNQLTSQSDILSLSRNTTIAIIILIFTQLLMPGFMKIMWFISFMPFLVIDHQRIFIGEKAVVSLCCFWISAVRETLICHL